MKRFSLALVSILGLVSSAFAQTSYNRFGPVNGVLVGDSTTYYTSAADSADIIGLWSGSCSLSTFLRGDGTCAAASPSAFALTRVDDTNVTLTLGGSPSTSLLAATSLTLGWNGQLAVSRGGTGAGTLTGYLKGNGTSAFTANATIPYSDLTGTPTLGALASLSTIDNSLWSGTDLSVSNGGTGVSTLTGIAKGNGTSAFTAAASSDVIGLWTGTCNSGTFLRADGTCQAVGAGSGSVTSISQGTGITATPNPITTTGSIAVDQAFTPTWTGVHTFSGAGNRVTVNGTSGNDLVTLQNSGVAKGYLAADGSGAGLFSGSGETGQGFYVSATSAITQVGGSTVASTTASGTTMTLPLVVDSGGGADELSVGTGFVDLLGAVTVNGSVPCTFNGTGCPATFAWNTISKGSTTSRNTTTTLAADPDLVTGALSGGNRYRFEFCLYYSGQTTGTQGIKFVLNRTNVGSIQVFWYGAQITGTTPVAAVGYGGNTPGTATGQLAIATIDVSGGISSTCGEGSILNGTGVSLAFEWAQNSSSANNTNLLGGSYIRWQVAN